MQRTLIFATNVQALLAYEGLTRREAALKWGLDYDLLTRWSSAGLSHPHKKSIEQLRQLMSQFGFTELHQFWEPWVSPLNEVETPAKIVQDVESRIAGLPLEQRLEVIQKLQDWINLYQPSVVRAIAIEAMSSNRRPASVNPAAAEPYLQPPNSVSKPPAEYDPVWEDGELESQEDPDDDFPEEYS
jgi:hypothetical protein